MIKILKFKEFLNENDGGGGVAFASLNSNGMGNVVAPTVGATPGAVWGSGSGTIGSGDLPAYNQPKKFTTTRKKNKKKKTKYFTKL